jgi:hypothetical protein
VLDRSAPQKHVWRANIILATADGCGTAEIMRRSGKSKPVVWALLRLSKRTPGSEMRSCGYRQPARRIQGQKFGAENQNGHPPGRVLADDAHRFSAEQPFHLWMTLMRAKPLVYPIS